MIKDTRYIIKRVIIGVLVSLILSFIFSVVHAEEMTMSASDGYWYNGNTQVLQVTPTNRSFNSEPFAQYQGSTSVTAQYLRSVWYFPESQNDIVLSNQWDISFVLMGYGNYSVTLGGSACYILNTGFNYSEISHGTYSDTVNGTGYTDSNSFSSVSQEPIWSSIYCPNVKLARVPTEVKIWRNWTSTDDNNKNRYIISKIWYLRKTLNDNSSITGAINSQTNDIINNNNSNTNSINSSINDVNDSINDDNVDDPSNSLSNMDSKIATNSVISDLLLLPVTLFQKILNSINGTCSTFNLGSLLGTNLTLPCINLSNILGSALYGVIDILLCGIFVLSMRKKFVNIFQNITSLKDRGNELE